nr:immunoglobulin light chain junction region [Macaca mulatta]MOX31132.1 immunoglobulin light chain junction region [Macaca mulatta]
DYYCSAWDSNVSGPLF